MAAVGAFVASFGIVSASVVRLLPLLVATVETAGMYVLGSEGSYLFSPTSTAFLRYTALKSAVFLAVPEIEDRMLASGFGLRYESSS